MLIFAVIGLIAVNCSKEPNISKSGKKGEEGFVQLTIRSEAPGTRGSVGTEGATAQEVAIQESQGLKVYVFNLDGSLDYAGNQTLIATGTPNTFKSAPFQVTTGDKYFFVFANDGANRITAPSPATTMDNFMKQAVTAVYDETGNLDIATANNFLLGTLWKSTNLAAAGGTSTDPKTVNLTIGRLSSKINLESVVTTSTGMNGTFTAPRYRIGTMPYKINTAGITEGATSPVGTHGILVYSHAHNAPYWDVEVPPPTIAFNATDYHQNADFKTVLGDGVTTFNTNIFYATENTSARGNNGFLYYGNTTYIQIETKYTPVDAEIYDPETLLPDAILPETETFFVGYLNDGTRLIFNRLPVEETDDADINYTAGFFEYENGLNYHKFAIYDVNETDDVMRFRVLRNHYYMYKVTNFKDLGSHTNEVDPEEPIPSTTTVDIQVMVLPWDKVADDVEV
jgi:hypothetical protein